MTTFSSSGTIDNNVWTHVAVVLDKENQLIKFFKDNVLEGSIPASSLNLVNDTNTISIGKNDLNSYFSGMMDDVRLYDRVVTTTEMDKIFNEKYNNNLILHYDFEDYDHANAIVRDESKYRNHGQLINKEIESEDFTKDIGKYAISGTAFKTEVDQYIQIPTTTDNVVQGKNLENCTMTAWVKTNNLNSFEPIIHKDGVFSFGLNYGHATLQLGDGSTLHPLPGLTNMDMDTYVHGDDSGSTTQYVSNITKIYGEGTNDYMFGNNSATDLAVPTLIFDSYVTNMEIFNVGGHFGAFYTKNRKLYMFGNNEYGQFGNGVTSDTGHAVTEVTSFLPFTDKITGISCSRDISLLLTEKGEVWGSGIGTTGFLGQGNNTSSSTFVKIPVLDKVVKVIAGGTTMLFLTENNECYFTGYSQPNGSNTFFNVPTKVILPGNEKIIDMNCTAQACSLLTEDKYLYMCGENSTDARLGNNSSSSGSSQFKHITYFQPGTPNEVKKMVSIHGDTFILTVSGQVWNMGRNLSNPNIENGQYNPNRFLRGDQPSINGSIYFEDCKHLASLGTGTAIVFQTSDNTIYNFVTSDGTIQLVSGLPQEPLYTKSRVFESNTSYMYIFGTYDPIPSQPTTEKLLTNVTFNNPITLSSDLPGQTLELTSGYQDGGVAVKINKHQHLELDGDSYSNVNLNTMSFSAWIKPDSVEGMQPILSRYGLENNVKFQMVDDEIMLSINNADYPTFTNLALTKTFDVTSQSFTVSTSGSVRDSSGGTLYVFPLYGDYSTYLEDLLLTHAKTLVTPVTFKQDNINLSINSTFTTFNKKALETETENIQYDSDFYVYFVAIDNLGKTTIDRVHNTAATSSTPIDANFVLTKLALEVGTTIDGKLTLTTPATNNVGIYATAYTNSVEFPTNYELVGTVNAGLTDEVFEFSLTDVNYFNGSTTETYVGGGSYVNAINVYVFALDATTGQRVKINNSGDIYTPFDGTIMSDSVNGTIGTSYRLTSDGISTVIQDGYYQVFEDTGDIIHSQGTIHSNNIMNVFDNLLVSDGATWANSWEGTGFTPRYPLWGAYEFVSGKRTINKMVFRQAPASGSHFISNVNIYYVNNSGDDVEVNYTTSNAFVFTTSKENEIITIEFDSVSSAIFKIRLNTLNTTKVGLSGWTLYGAFEYQSPYATVQNALFKPFENEIIVSGITGFSAYANVVKVYDAIAFAEDVDIDTLTNEYLKTYVQTHSINSTSVNYSQFTVGTFESSFTVNKVRNLAGDLIDLDETNFADYKICVVVEDSLGEVGSGKFLQFTSPIEGTHGVYGINGNLKSYSLIGGRKVEAIPWYSSYHVPVSISKADAFAMTASGTSGGTNTSQGTYPTLNPWESIGASYVVPTSFHFATDMTQVDTLYFVSADGTRGVEFSLQDYVDVSLDANDYSQTINILNQYGYPSNLPNIVVVKRSAATTEDPILNIGTTHSYEHMFYSDSTGNASSSGHTHMADVGGFYIYASLTSKEETLREMVSVSTLRTNIETAELTDTITFTGEVIPDETNQTTYHALATTKPLTSGEVRTLIQGGTYVSSIESQTGLVSTTPLENIVLTNVLDTSSTTGPYQIAPSTTVNYANVYLYATDGLIEHDDIDVKIIDTTLEIHSEPTQFTNVSSSSINNVTISSDNLAMTISHTAAIFTSTGLTIDISDNSIGQEYEFEYFWTQLASETYTYGGVSFLSAKNSTNRGNTSAGYHIDIQQFFAEYNTQHTATTVVLRYPDPATFLMNTGYSITASADFGGHTLSGLPEGQFPKYFTIKVVSVGKKFTSNDLEMRAYLDEERTQWVYTIPNLSHTTDGRTDPNTNTLHVNFWTGPNYNMHFQNFHKVELTPEVLAPHVKVTSVSPVASNTLTISGSAYSSKAGITTIKAIVFAPDVNLDALDESVVKAFINTNGTDVTSTTPILDLPLRQYEVGQFVDFALTTVYTSTDLSATTNEALVDGVVDNQVAIIAIDNTVETNIGMGSSFVPITSTKYRITLTSKPGPFTSPSFRGTELVFAKQYLEPTEDYHTANKTYNVDYTYSNSSYAYLSDGSTSQAGAFTASSPYIYEITFSEPSPILQVYAGSTDSLANNNVNSYDETITIEYWNGSTYVPHSVINWDELPDVNGTTKATSGDGYFPWQAPYNKVEAQRAFPLIGRHGKQIVRFDTKQQHWFHYVAYGHDETNTTGVDDYTNKTFDFGNSYYEYSTKFSSLGNVRVY